LNQVFDSGYLLKTLRAINIRRGLLIFSAITLSALAVIFILTHSSDTIQALANFNMGFLHIILALLAFDTFLGAYRNHVFMRRLDPAVTFLTSLRANLANTFVGAITPSQGGGGPAQFYIYHSRGGSIGQAVFVAAFNYLSTLIVFITGAIVALLILSGRFGNRYTGVIILCFVIFIIEFILIVLALARPCLFTRLLNRVTSIVSRRFPGAGKKLEKFTMRISAEVESFRDSGRLFMKGNRMMFPLSLLLTLILYVNKYLMGYMVLRGLGVDCDLMTVLAIQSLLMCIVYFSPSPGGSGIAELSIAALMSAIVPESKLGLFSMLQRFFLLYLPLLLGSIVVFRELRDLTLSKSESNSHSRSGGSEASRL